MRNDARIATLIELVDKAVHNCTPADKMLQNFFRENRFIGSKDRRFLSDMLWKVLRNRYALEHKAGSSNARKMVIAMLAEDNNNDLDLLFTGTKYAPNPIMPDELKFNLSEPPLEISPFLLAKLKQRFPETWKSELQAFNKPARFDLRANTLKKNIEIIKDITKANKTPFSKLGLCFEQNFNISQNKCYLDGLVDIQDEGSQLICEFCEPKAGDKILDLCAGAGGKSLTLAILMQNKGEITAYDKYSKRMKDLMPRALRSGISIINTKPFHKTKFDIVLIDAPCSGSGTIRRSVDRKWKINPQNLKEILSTQAEILQSASTLTNKIIYSTCSFFCDENEEQIQNFLNKNKDFTKTKEQFISPLSHGTDGFYMCCL